MVGRRYGLELKFNAFETGRIQSARQALNRILIVGCGFGAYKSHRTPDHRVSHWAAELLLRSQTNVAYDIRNQILQRKAAAKDLRALQAAAGEK